MMLKTAVVNTIDLPTTNAFLSFTPGLQTTASSASASADTNSGLTKNESTDSGLGVRYGFHLAPAPLQLGSSFGIGQASRLSCYDDEYNHNEHFCLNTNTLTKLTHCECNKQQTNKKNNDNNDNNDDDVDESRFVVNVPKSKVSSKNGPGFDSIRKKDGCWIKPCYYNKYTSCVIENTPDEVISGLLTICAHYAGGASVFEDNNISNNNNDCNNSTNIDTFSREIEYRVNKEDFVIDGIVFVNHKPIKFMISVWHDSEDMDVFSPVRVEFQKTRGDSSLFHLFWSEMLELMITFRLENSNNNKLFGEISDCTRGGKSCLETFLLPLPLPPMKNEMSKFTEIDDESQEGRQDEMNQDLAPNGDIDKEDKKGNEALDDDDDEEHDDDCYNDFVNDKIGGLSIDWQREYEYTKGDLDDMALDLIENYRDEALDVLANICNTLENNLQFHKLLCQHSKIIKTIASDIINSKNYDNMAKLRGGLCVLLKLIGKKSGKSELTKEKNSIQETTKKLEKQLKLENKTTAKTTATTITTITRHNDCQPGEGTPSKTMLGVNLGYFGFGGNDGSLANRRNTSKSASKMSSEIESVIEYLVNETNLLKQFPLLLENSSKIVQNHTIRLMNSMFDYIPEKLKMSKNVSEKINFSNFNNQ